MQEADDEGGAVAGLGFEFELAAEFFDDGGAGDGEALAGAAADFLGGEKWLEDAVADFFGDAGAGVGDADFDPRLRLAGGDGDFALAALGLDDVADGMGGVDEE